MWAWAKGDLFIIQTLLLFKCKLLCYRANLILVSITTSHLQPHSKSKAWQLSTQWPIIKRFEFQMFGFLYSYENTERPYRFSKSISVSLNVVYINIPFYQGVQKIWNSVQKPFLSPNEFLWAIPSVVQFQLMNAKSV